MPAEVKPDRKAEGKKFMEKVLAKIKDEAKRKEMEALLFDDEIVEFVGTGTLAQEEFSRAMAGVQGLEERNKNWKINLDTWHADKLKDLEEGAAAKARLAALGSGGGGNPNPDPDNPNPNPNTQPAARVDLTGYLKKEEVEKFINDRIGAASAEVVPLVTTTARLVDHHRATFGEALDIDGLVAHCRKTGLAMDRGGYEDFIKDKLKAKEEQRIKELETAAEKRGEERALQRLNATPYPVGDGAEITTLSGLTQDKSKPTEFGVDAAIKMYNERTRAS